MAMKTSEVLERVKNQCVRSNKYYSVYLISEEGLNALDKAIKWQKELEYIQDNPEKALAVLSKAFMEGLNKEESQ